MSSVSVKIFVSIFNWTEKKWTKKKENLGDGLVLKSKSSVVRPLVKVVAWKEEHMDLLWFRSGIELML